MTGPDRPLAGRHAIVTGGGRGIGAAIATAFARAGASLTLLGRDRRALDLHAAALADEHGAEVLAIPCDVADPALVRHAFATSRARFPRPYLLVNNAGQAEAALFMDTPDEVWERLLDVNLMGTVHCIRETLPDMLKTGTGRIVNIASLSGLRGSSHTTAYSAAKHAVVGLTRALAAEVRSRGVTVNAVCPGYTETAMLELAVRNLMAGGRSEAEARARLAATLPRGEPIRPAEVAEVVLWLATASAVSGEAVPVAGGRN